MTLPLAQRVFACLANGTEHSGESLARQLEVTRSAVWKAIEQLRELGCEITAVTNRGYRLAHATEPLDAAAIRAAIDPPALRECFRSIEVQWSLPSTNSSLLEREPPPPGRLDALLVEHQSAGRGRRGRSWLAPLGGSLCVSVAVRFEQPPPGLGALPLCAGLAVAAALESRGLEGFGLKWPNDLLAQPSGAKLGGLLAELRAEAGGPAHAVIGLGLNLALGEALRAQIEASGGVRATDLRALGADPGARNAIAGAVLARLAEYLQQFATHGFPPFASRWGRHDVLRDRPVTISGVGQASMIDGIARGIDADGALRLERADGRIESLIAGEVSVRAAAGSRSR